MAFKPGYLGHFSLDTAAGSLTNLSAYIDNVSVPVDSDMLDVSVMGTAAKAFIVGQTGGGQISVSGPQDSAMSLHIGSLIAAQNAGTASHSWQWGPGGSVVGQTKVTGECLVASYNPGDSSVSGRSEYSLTLQVTGAITLAAF